MVVAENYRKDPLFIKVSELRDVIEVCYLPDNQGVLKRHRFYSRAFSELAEKYNPQFVIQHNHVYPINMYLYYWSKKKNTQIITIQMGREAMNWDADFSARKAFAISRIRNKYPILPVWLASIIRNIREEISFLLDYFLLPFIFLRKIFHPALKVYSGKVFKQNSENYHDYYLMYKTREKERTEKEMGQSEKIMLIQHPVEIIGQECNNFLYPTDIEEDRITILPSYGFVDLLIIQKKDKQDDIKKQIFQIWSEVINIFHNKLPKWEIDIKLHQNSKGDFIWNNILKEIKKNCNNVVILKESEKAEKWILKSKIVVSDVSTVLWWTSFFKTKLAISLDLFGYMGGDDMKDYDDVVYITNIRQLKKMDLLMELNRHTQKLENKLRDKNDLIDILTRI